MKTFEFTIIASGLDPDAPDFADRFFAAGCDDATISFQKGVIVLDFARQSRTFVNALISAARDVSRAGARIEHIEPDSLVSMSDIARRANLTRAAISHYTSGERGSDFPRPVAGVVTDRPLWDWLDVSRWMHRNDRLAVEAVVHARLIKEVNAALHRDHAERRNYVTRIIGARLRARQPEHAT